MVISVAASAVLAQRLDRPSAPLRAMSLFMMFRSSVI
jgi:hypothetical protein